MLPVHILGVNYRASGCGHHHSLSVQDQTRSALLTDGLFLLYPLPLLHLTLLFGTLPERLRDNAFHTHNDNLFLRSHPILSLKPTVFKLSLKQGNPVAETTGNCYLNGYIDFNPLNRANKDFLSSCGNFSIHSSIFLSNFFLSILLNQTQ